MATLPIRNVPAEVHRALQMRAAAHGHSIETEIRHILENYVKSEQRLRMGNALAAIGQCAGLEDKDFVVFEIDSTPAEPMGFE